MNSKRHLFFRWTPRTAKISLMYIVVVPSILGYFAYKTDVSGYPAELSLVLSVADRCANAWDRASLISRGRGEATPCTSDKRVALGGRPLHVYTRGKIRIHGLIRLDFVKRVYAAIFLNSIGNLMLWLPP